MAIAAESVHTRVVDAGVDRVAAGSEPRGVDAESIRDGFEGGFADAALASFAQGRRRSPDGRRRTRFHSQLPGLPPNRPASSGYTHRNRNPAVVVLSPMAWAIVWTPRGTADAPATSV